MLILSLGENVQIGSQDQVVTGLVSSQVDKATPPKLLTGVDTGCTDRAVDSVEVDTDRLDGLADGHADRPEGSKINTVKNIFNKVLSSSGPLPITMPFAPDEHLLLQPPSENVPLIIYDQEPSSIIAYSLSCPDYSKQLEQLTQDSQDTSSRRGDLAASSSSTDSDGGKKSASSVLSFFRGATREKSPSRMTGLMGKYNVDTVKYIAKLDQDNAEENDGAMYAGPDPEGRKANKKDGPDVNQHIELQFSDSSARFYCRIYFAEQFQKLRSLIFPSGEERYIRSLSRCYTWLAMGGKSGLTFCKTQDDRFILKQMSRFEVQSFMEFAPHYFEYITKAFTEKKPTALAKILGVYRIGYRNTQTNAALKQDLLVMENLFYGRDITQVFDLKGSVRNRLVNTSGKRVDELVLLDENLLKSSIDSPLYIRPHSKFILNNAINNDTHFLSSHIVMDYSLLVGLDSSRNELVVGIIDYIRTFTWDKKLEMVVKSTYSQWGGQGKMPTVVSPELYRTRFLQAMNRYFLLVPDQWTGLDTSVNLN
ncbi:1-phosphatidylinositol 3-phosphate 5-kinase [Lamellibrachia satsuma]|nr:1-phosphatidylinositol 3-phosphate 5-kinase [Lamellibrachia satsuma]